MRRLSPHLTRRVLARGGEPARPYGRSAGGVLYLERSDLHGTFSPSRPHLPVSCAAAVFILNQSKVRDPGCAYSLARGDARSAGSVGRRILPIQIEAAVEDAWGRARAGTGARRRGCVAGESGT